MLAKWNGKLNAVSFLLNLIPLGLPNIKRKAGCEACQIHVEKCIPPLRSLFNKSPEQRHDKREFCAF